MTDLIRITGLWEYKDKNGAFYLKGTLGAANILIYKNLYKETDNHPDYNIYFSKKEKKAD